MGAGGSTAVVGSATPRGDQYEALHGQREYHQEQSSISPEDQSRDYLREAEPGERVPVYHAAEDDAEDDLAGSSAFATQKGMRTIGLEALLQLPKLALAELFFPADLPCGPRAAAQQVRQHRGQHRALPFTSCANRYRVFLLRERLQKLGPQGCASVLAPQQSLVGVPGAAESAAAHAAGDDFDFLSLSSLAVMDAGIYMTPSWQELASQVGTVDGMRRLLLELQEERQQIKWKLRATRAHTPAEPANSPPDISERAGSSKTVSIEADRGDKIKLNPECSDSAEPSSPLQGGLKLLERNQADPMQQHQVKSAHEVFLNENGSAAPHLTQLLQSEEQRWLQLGKSERCEAPLASALKRRGLVAQELAHLQVACLELDEDMGVLQRACSELEALLRRVWDAERLPQDACIDRMAFRRLWCHPQNDAQQSDTADKLFALCYSNSKKQLRARSTVGEVSTSSDSSDYVTRSLTGVLADSAVEELGFNELLGQLPPKALEWLWCSAELRRKERQHYRYFWI